MQAPWSGFAHTLGTLFLLTALIDGAASIVLGERLWSPILSYRDEAAFFLVCALGVRCWAYALGSSLRTAPTIASQSAANFCRAAPLLLSFEGETSCRTKRITIPRSR